MAHVQKFTASGAGKIIGHCEREKSKYGDFLKYKTNSEIDPSKTHKNIPVNFGDGLTSHERLKKRLEEVHVHKRKDVNVMCDWVVTYPQKLLQDETSIKTFYAETISFLFDRYGRENCVSCNIHMDETTPHMHFCFVPVVFDTKKDRYKVSAKEVLNKKELSTFHQDLEKHLMKTIGLEKGLILSGITKEQGGNLSVDELKEKNSRILELEKNISAAKKEKNDLSLEIKEKKAEIESLSVQIAKMKTTVEDLSKDIYNLPLFIKEYSREISKESQKTIQPKFSTDKKSQNPFKIASFDKGDDFDLDL